MDLNRELLAQNAAYAITKVFEGVNGFCDRIVAFVDVMGVRNRMMNAKCVEDIAPFTRLMYMFANQPFAKERLRIVPFSDCMYVICDFENLGELISLLSNYAYQLMMNRKTSIVASVDDRPEVFIKWDCLRLRGGITFGPLLDVDGLAFEKSIPVFSNMVVGPATISAYELESNKAIFPRIVVDGIILELLNKKKLSTDDYYIRMDTRDGKFFLDYMWYMFKGGKDSSGLLQECIDYVEEEIKGLLKIGKEHTADQLRWHVDYLKKYV